MIKKNFIKIFIILFFLSGCGYTPIYSSKNYDFSILKLESIGNSKLNKIIVSNLSQYRNVNAEKNLNLVISSNLQKKISSKDSKGDPKTFRLFVNAKIIIKDLDKTIKEKDFSKTVDYNNRNKKSELKKYENELAKNLAEKISEEIITYLVSN
tara:strand:- start:4135 stop:4593 length:459 start_codon:yes stop_codon:yes gene_type:complete